MQTTSGRLLTLLGLLQSRAQWTGRELAERLSVTPRTVRNDIERLRELDYPVEAVRGPAGHYRLGVGAKMPPLLLDDEEAVAVAVGLRAITGMSRRRGDQRPRAGQAGRRAPPPVAAAGPRRPRRRPDRAGEHRQQRAGSRDPTRRADGRRGRDPRSRRAAPGLSRDGAAPGRAVSAGQLATALVRRGPRPGRRLLAEPAAGLDGAPHSGWSPVHSGRSYPVATIPPSCCGPPRRPAGASMSGSPSTAPAEEVLSPDQPDRRRRRGGRRPDLVLVTGCRQRRDRRGLHRHARAGLHRDRAARAGRAAADRLRAVRPSRTPAILVTPQTLVTSRPPQPS